MPAAKLRGISQLSDALGALESIEGSMKEVGRFFTHVDTMRCATVPEVPAEMVCAVANVTAKSIIAARALLEVPSFVGTLELFNLGAEVADLFDPKTPRHSKGRLFEFNELDSHVAELRTQVERSLVTLKSIER
jgi:hypothetical protein